MDIDELIGAAVEQQPTRFATAFDDLMGQKIAARLEDERISYAQQMFAEPEDDENEDYDDYEDNVDFDIDDDEFEDIDLDDLDLEDINTEEEDDDGEDA
jgi:hypothetical protein